MNFVWPESARSELRAIDREVAIQILNALTRYGDSGQGDVKALAGNGSDTLGSGGRLPDHFRCCAARNHHACGSGIVRTSIDELARTGLQFWVEDAGFAIEPDWDPNPEARGGTARPDFVARGLARFERRRLELRRSGRGLREAPARGQNRKVRTHRRPLISDLLDSESAEPQDAKKVAQTHCPVTSRHPKPSR
jgi:hypothetical protein